MNIIQSDLLFWLASALIVSVSVITILYDICVAVDVETVHSKLKWTAFRSTIVVVTAAIAIACIYKYKVSAVVEQAIDK